MAEKKFDMEEQQEDTQHGKFLTFALGGEVFGIEIRYVTEIIGMQPVSSLPEVPEYVKGIINLRGRIIPVIDVRTKFKLGQVEYTDRTCIVVIEFDDISVGLIVDNVAEVISIEDENIVPPPAAKTGVQNRYIKGIGKVGENVKLLLDCEKLFEKEEVEQIASIL